MNGKQRRKGAPGAGAGRGPKGGGGKKGGGGGKPQGGKGRLKSALIIIAVALVTAITGIIILSWFVIGKGKPTKELSVYFIDQSGDYLVAEERKIETGPLESEINGVLNELIKGPRDKELTSPMPQGTRLLSVSVKGKLATVNFSSEIIKNHQGGSSGEVHTVYSIIDSIGKNFPEIKEVQILIEGKRENTLAGHIDITYPLPPDMKLTKG